TWRLGKPLGARATANHMANGGLAGAGRLALCADSAGNQPVALPPATEPQLADADSDKAGNLPAAGVVVQRLVAGPRSRRAQCVGTARGLPGGGECPGVRGSER